MRLFWAGVAVLGVAPVHTSAQEPPNIEVVAANWWESGKENATSFYPWGPLAISDSGAIFMGAQHERPGLLALRGAYIAGQGQLRELTMSFDFTPGDDRLRFYDRFGSEAFPGEAAINDSGQAIFNHGVFVHGGGTPPNDVPWGDTLWYSGGRRLTRLISEFNEVSPGFEPAQSGQHPRMSDFHSFKITNSGVYTFLAGVNPPGIRVLYWGLGGSLHVAARDDVGSPRILHYDMARNVSIGYYTADSPGALSNSSDLVYRFTGSESELVLGPQSILPGLEMSPGSYTLWDVDEDGAALVLAWPFSGAGPLSALGLFEISYTGNRSLVRFNQESPTSEGELTITLPPFFGGPTVFSGGRAYFLANYQGFDRNGHAILSADRQAGVQVLYTIGDLLPGASFQNTAFDGGFAANSRGATVSLLKLKGEGLGDGQTPVTALVYQDMAGQFHVLLHAGQSVQVGGQSKTVYSIFLSEDALTEEGEVVCSIGFLDGAAICRILPPDAIKVQGSLSGTVRSSQPTLTEREHAVHRAVITVYSQPGGWIRSRRAGESESAYEDYVRGRLGPPVQRLILTEADAGEFTTPLLQGVKLQATGVLRDAFYTLEVSSAETDEWHMDDLGNVDENRIEPLNFLSLLRINVRSPTEGLVLELQPVDEPAIKRHLAENLSAMAPNYWGPPEALVIDHLDDLESGTPLTAVKREGLRRAILGERAVLQAGDFADAFIKEMLATVGNLLADIYSDATKKESDALKKAKVRMEAARERAKFNVPQPAAALVEAASEADFALVNRADLMGFGSNYIKLLKPHLEFGLVQAGMDPQLAADFVKYFVIASRSIFNGLKDAEASRGRKGANAASLGVQEVIKALVKQFHPVFFDGASFSFAAVTAGVLEDSHLWMSTWDSFDDADFLRDRAEYNQFYTEFLLSMEGYSNAVMAGQVAAEYFSSAEAVFSIGALAVKQAKGAELAAKLAKYLSHIEAVVVSAGTIYGVIPFKLERLNHIAFDSPGKALAKSAQGMAGDIEPEPLSVSTALPGDSQILASLSVIEQGLAISDIGAVLFASVEPGSPTALVQAYASWKKACRRYETAASAASAARNEPTLQQQIALVQQRRVSLLGAGIALGEELGLLFEGVLGGGFVDPRDATYIAKRSDVLVALQAFRSALAATTRELETLDALLEATPGPIAPALVLEAGPATSNTTADAQIAAASETFTIRLTAYNAGGNALPPIPLRLTLVPEGAAFAGQAVKSLPALATGAEAFLEWTVTIGAIDDWSTLFISAEVDDEAEVPVGLIELGAEWVLNVDPVLFDADLDGMPDEFESAYGLNPASSDAADDNDGDLLSNLQEFNLGTRPDLADTDGDGVPDGVEVMGNGTTPPSDPLLPDTDGDGVGDAEDGAPHNPDSFAPEAFAPPSHVQLTKHRIYLHPDAPSASVGLQTVGGSPALVQAESLSPGLFTVSMSSPALIDAGGLLFSARQPFPTMTPHTFVETGALLHNLSAPLAPPQRVRVIITRQLPQGVLEELEVGEGWSWSAWYGYYYSAFEPWLWSQPHGWQYLQDNFAWDAQLLAWLYLQGDAYPWLYSFGGPQLPQGWYYFAYTDGSRGFWSPGMGWIILSQ